MSSVIIKKNDEIMMSLVHYFVTKENYSPIQVHGVKDEIWLENLNGPYRIIRINCNRVINDEQYKFDIFKMEHIIKQIKRKTLSFKVNALNICLDMSSKVNLNLKKNIDTISINSLDDVKNNKAIEEIFPNINKELIDNADGLDLIINVTNDINEKTDRENKKFSEVFSPKKIIFTNLIIFICVVMFIVCFLFGGNILSFNPNLLALLGANNILLVRSGQIWRLITCAFLHVGLIHLIVNMYSLMVLGTQVETFIGKWKFLFIYLMSALGSSLFSLVFSDTNIVAVGASGAIFGLMGALLYFGYHYRLYLRDALRNQIIPIIFLNLLIGFLASGIDNAAHIGGLIAGYLSAMAIGIDNKSQKRDIINGWIVLGLYIIFLSIVVFFLRDLT